MASSYAIEVAAFDCLLRQINCDEAKQNPDRFYNEHNQLNVPDNNTRPSMIDGPKSGSSNWI